MKRALGWLVGLAGMSWLLWLTVQWLQLAPPVTSTEVGLPDVAVSGGRLKHYNVQGRLAWSLEAEAIALDQRARTTRAKGVSITFQTPDGDQTNALNVLAEGLTMDTFSNDLTFEGRVEARDDQGLRFVTQGGRWSQRDQVLEGEAPVSVVRPGVHGWTVSFEASGFRYDVRTGKLALWAPEGKARFRLVPEAGP